MLIVHISAPSFPSASAPMTLQTWDPTKTTELGPSLIQTPCIHVFRGKLEYPELYVLRYCSRWACAMLLGHPNPKVFFSWNTLPLTFLSVFLPTNYHLLSFSLSFHPVEILIPSPRVSATYSLPVLSSSPTVCKPPSYIPIQAVIKHVGW